MSLYLDYGLGIGHNWASTLTNLLPKSSMGPALVRTVSFLVAFKYFESLVAIMISPIVSHGPSIKSLV